MVQFQSPSVCTFFTFLFTVFFKQQTPQFVQAFKPIVFASPGQAMKVNGKDLVFTNIQSNSTAKVKDAFFSITNNVFSVFEAVVLNPFVFIHF
jgi:hypothetical protein